MQSMNKKVKTLFDVLPKGRTKILHTGYHKMPHFVYTADDLESIKVEHIEPKNFKQRIAYRAIKLIRTSYDTLTRYEPGNMTKVKWIQRCLILQTVAGVPGMVGGMARHLRSIRSMERDRGWIHQLMEEADNQRFHLFIFLHLKQPGIFERLFILGLQGIFFNFFFIGYLLSPKFCHRFVGYLEQEAVKTYTGMLADIDNPDGCLHHWNKIPATYEAMDYYNLPQGSSFRDVINCIRADEAVHRETNHYLASIDQDEELEQEQLVVINKQRRKIDKNRI